MAVKTQQAQYVGPMLIQCWSTVCDAGSTLDQHRANVLHLLGNYYISKYSGERVNICENLTMKNKMTTLKKSPTLKLCIATATQNCKW